MSNAGTGLPDQDSGDVDDNTDHGRRQLLQGASVLAGAGVMGLLGKGAWAAGSDRPELKEVRVGFLPLTDCASVIMAAVLGFDQKYGIKIILSRESSWAGVRDKLAAGALDAAHVLYGLLYGVHLGVGGRSRDMAVLMTLNQNGQAITLSKQLAEKGATDGAALAKQIRTGQRDYSFAHTFPTGTHAMWLYYWLAAHGIDPLKDVHTLTVPPPQMVAAMRAGKLDGYCAGEPWNHMAVAAGVGVTATVTQEIWRDHPDKVLGATAEFAKTYPRTACALIAAVLEAGRWIDASPANKSRMVETIAAPSYLNTPVEVIAQRIQGYYQNGLGKSWRDSSPLKFFDGGAVNFPYLSDGMWFLTQQRRWGLLKTDPDYLAVAQAVNQVDLYKAAAAMAKVDVPPQTSRAASLMDGRLWDGSDPTNYAASFQIRA